MIQIQNMLNINSLIVKKKDILYAEGVSLND